jgi:hypothetical protein
MRYSRALLDAKGKTVFSSDSKLMLHIDWNESKLSPTISNAGCYNGSLIASAASIATAASIAASAIASPRVASSAGVVYSGRVAGRGAQSEMASAVTGITATGRTGTIGGRSANGTAFRQSRQQQPTNQHCNAERNSERYHRIRHLYPILVLCIAKTPCPSHDSLLNVTSPFIEHSSGM